METNSVSSSTVFRFYSNRFRICEKKQERDGNKMLYCGNGNENGSMFFRPYFQNPIFTRIFLFFPVSRIPF
jgi:hypothetical protein